MFQENFDLFFNTDEFALEAKVSKSDNPQEDFTVKGIFEDPYAAAELGSYRIVATNPVFLCEWTVDIAGLRHAHILTIGDTRYRIEGVPHHDGTGLARIHLIDESYNDEQSDQRVAVDVPKSGGYYQ